MPRYFFNLYDGITSQDLIGSELPSDDAARLEAMRMLPEIALHQVVRNGDKQSFVVLVTDEAEKPIYSATLSFAGVWLKR